MEVGRRGFSALAGPEPWTPGLRSKVMRKSTRTNERREVLAAVFYLAALAREGLLAAVTLLAILPLAVVALGGYCLCWLGWLLWREIVPVGRESRNRQAFADVVVPIWQALIEFDRRSHADFNTLVHGG